MSQPTAKSSSRVDIPVRLEELAESIWRLPRREREALGDILEEQFVETVRKRSREIPRLRKAGKLVTLADLKREFLSR